MNKLTITVSIDDTHPEQNWGCEGDQSVEYLKELNKEFGCKFILFTPSNYHNKFPLSQYKDWIQYWKQYDWIELAAHGHQHKRFVIDPGCRECEFIELEYNQAKNRLKECLNEWELSGHKPTGWRMPGWLATQGSFDAVSELFDYTAIHSYLNNNIKVNNKIIKGENSIHNDDSLIISDNMIHFQSHIWGEYNKNNWTEENYLNVKAILSYLKENYILEYKLFNEL
jgi:peptidoglycan/xylan/chitin deacetylase (PgdA/CDA1 family)